MTTSVIAQPAPRSLRTPMIVLVAVALTIAALVIGLSLRSDTTTHSQPATTPATVAVSAAPLVSPPTISAPASALSPEQQAVAREFAPGAFGAAASQPASSNTCRPVNHAC